MRWRVPFSPPNRWPGLHADPPPGPTPPPAGSAAAVRPMLAPSQSALWLIRFEELTVTECLGAGSFGKVYSGEAAACLPVLGASWRAMWTVRRRRRRRPQLRHSLFQHTHHKRPTHLTHATHAHIHPAGEWNSTPVAIKLLLGEDGQVAGTPTQPSPMILKLEEVRGCCLVLAQNLDLVNLFELRCEAAAWRLLRLE